MKKQSASALPNKIVLHCYAQLPQLPYHLRKLQMEAPAIHNGKHQNDTDNNCNYNNGNCSRITFDFPKEIWQQIMQLCSTQTKLNIRQTSKRMREIADVSGVLCFVVDNCFAMEVLEQSLLPFYFSHYHTHWNYILGNVLQRLPSAQFLKISDDSAVTQVYPRTKPSRQGEHDEMSQGDLLVMIPKTVQGLSLHLNPCKVNWQHLAEFTQLTSLHLPRCPPSNDLLLLPPSVIHLSVGEFDIVSNTNVNNSNNNSNVNNNNNNNNNNSEIVDLSHMPVLRTLRLDNVVCRSQFNVILPHTLTSFCIGLHASKLALDILQGLPQVPHMHITVFGRICFVPRMLALAIPPHLWGRTTVEMDMKGQLSGQEAEDICNSLKENLVFFC